MHSTASLLVAFLFGVAALLLFRKAAILQTYGSLLGTKQLSTNERRWQVVIPTYMGLFASGIAIGALTGWDYHWIIIGLGITMLLWALEGLTLRQSRSTIVLYLIACVVTIVTGILGLV